MFPLVTSTRPPNPNQPSDNSYPNRVRAFNKFTKYCRDNELKVEFWDVHFCQRSFNQLMRNETNKTKKYKDAWEPFIARNDEETAQSRRDLRFTNANSDGAPKISTFGMCLSGAFSTGAMEIFTCCAKRFCQVSCPWRRAQRIVVSRVFRGACTYHKQDCSHQDYSCGTG
jgi:hypothetical protein